MTCYTTCLCTAQLTFATGLTAEVVYGKGEALWESVRRLEVYGREGAICFDGDAGTSPMPTALIRSQSGHGGGYLPKTPPR
jgi:predicted dehydrogenase